MDVCNHKDNDVMNSLADCLSRALGEIGHPDPARQAANALVTKVRHEFGGNNLYIPGLWFPIRRARNAAIRRDYAAGVQISELAKNFNLTQQTIYSIVHSYPPRRRQEST